MSKHMDTLKCQRVDELLWIRGFRSCNSCAFMRNGAVISVSLVKDHVSARILPDLANE